MRNALTYLIAIILIGCATWLATIAYPADRPAARYVRAGVGMGRIEPPMVAQTNQDRLRQFQETKDAIQDLEIENVKMTTEMHADILIQLQADRNRLVGAGAFLAALLSVLQIAQLVEIRRRSK